MAVAFEKLFSTYPSVGRSDDPAERLQAAQVYFEAVLAFDVRDIETAVVNFLNGSAPGVNPSFAPPAPAVAAEVRRVMNLRLDSERRRARPQLPPPLVERTAESRARVAQMVREAQAALTVAGEDDEEATRRRQSTQSRVFDRFDPPQDEAEMMSRLGYTTGDSDEDGDWGGRAA